MTFRRSPDVITRSEGEQTLVFHQKTGWIGILNPGSSFIWEQCEEPVTPEQIVDRIERGFTLAGELADRGRLLAVVERHLALMQTGQLVEDVAA